MNIKMPEIKHPDIFYFFRKTFVFSLLFLILLFNSSLSCAQEISFEVSVDNNKVSLGASLQLNLGFYGMKDISAPELPDIDGFDWRYLGPSTRISMVNGQVSSSVTHIYTLIPLKVGKFKIPSFSVNYRGKTYTSKAIPVEVIKGYVETLSGEKEEGLQELDERIFLTLQAAKTKTYVNEVIPVKIKLYINQLSIRDIQIPEFIHEGFWVDEFSEPKQYREVLHDIQYDVIEFDTNVSGMNSGNFNIGPASLKCNLIVKKKEKSRTVSPFFDESFFGSDIFDDFFGRYERQPLNLTSKAIPITILDLPENNKPDNFSGALGNYNFYLAASPTEVNLGDPVTLKMTITGEGNFKTVKVPVIKNTDGFKIYDPEIKQTESEKTFEQIIIPKEDSIQEVPEVMFNFFDTRTGQYKTIVRGPIKIEVKPLPEGEELKVFGLPEEEKTPVRPKEILGRDIVYIKDSPGKLKPREQFLCKNKFFLAVQFIPFLALISIMIFQKRRERLETDIRYARRLRAHGKARKNLLKIRRLLDSQKTDKFFDGVFKTLQEYIGDKFHLPIAGITASVIDDLKRYNIDRKILAKIKDCFNECDKARYAPLSVTKEDMVRTLDLLEEIIDKLTKVKL